MLLFGVCILGYVLKFTCRRESFGYAGLFVIYVGKTVAKTLGLGWDVILRAADVVYVYVAYTNESSRILQRYPGRCTVCRV